ncbi:cuticle protein AM1199-like isoform X2 [Eriocheir sinensis]|uniref:cuticle protein AM1199-like isoform X1 n=1 Tax=Eriocheir sinensis TaxID=95602 RepID=UPI0021CAB61E|nr:cuticle protein AM1199-like isoform X1 [Eriocheir sinensis]XP_050720525.1 cuticle protein AM1199-like isoform X2 [Eriocheir sinensis]
MKLVLLLCLAAAASAAPQFGFFQNTRFPTRPRTAITPRPLTYRPIAILRDERENYGDGNFRYDFETENGIRMNAVGTPGSRGQSNIQGSYSYPLPEGGFAEVRYVADENGFRAESPLIPTPHPLPAHAIEQIRFAEEQRRRGFTFNK